MPTSITIGAVSKIRVEHKDIPDYNDLANKTTFEAIKLFVTNRLGETTELTMFPDKDCKLEGEL